MSNLITAALALALVQGPSEPWRQAGTLGNSGGSGGTLVTFTGKPSGGVGPVVDSAGTIWERGGSKQLNRYALDGRLLGSWPLPESTNRGTERAVLVGNTLILNIRGKLLRLAVDAKPGSTPEPLSSPAAAISSNAHGGRVAVFNHGGVSWLDPGTGKVTPGFTLEVRLGALCFDDRGILYGFEGRRVHAWNDGKPVAGYPKDFGGATPQRIGPWWYTHTWHGTINRYNERFEPEPGVVMGGASGSFIGYLPRSVDITHGTGLAHVRGDIYAVTGMEGVVQLIRWDAEKTRFSTVRRLGAMQGLTALGLDADGNIWTPRGSWRWSDSPEAPHTLGDVRPYTVAQPIVLQGRTLFVVKNHYGNIQWGRGPFIDASGWAHLESRGVEGFKTKKDLAGAATFETAQGKRRAVVALADGETIEFGLSDDGRLQGPVASGRIEGVKKPTSLAWFDGKMLVADGGEVSILESKGAARWSRKSAWKKFGGEAFIHSDGKLLAVSDTDGGTVRFFGSLNGRPSAVGGLNRPTLVAVSGARAVVYDSGNQRVVRLERAAPAAVAPRKPKVVQGMAGPSPVFNEGDYLDLGRPGGMSCRLAVAEMKDGLAVSLKTEARSARVGIAGRGGAYVLARGPEWLLPSGDWSDMRLAIRLESECEQERIGFIDGLPIHAPFVEDGNAWAPFDLGHYREVIAERKAQIRIEFEQPIEGKATIVVEDARGRRVRNLFGGRSFAKGRQTVVWDGLDDAGHLVAPGSYRWRGVTHSGLSPAYRMHFANGGEKTTRPWGPNHSVLHDAVSNGKLVFFAAPVTEGGWALMALDADGRFVQGYEHQQGFGIGDNAIGVDDRYLYCAQDGFGWSGRKGIDFNSPTWKATWDLTVARYDIRTGKVAEFPGKKRAFVADRMEVGPGSAHKDLGEYNLGGLAVHGGKIYVGSRDKKVVLVFEAATGKKLDAIALEGPRHLAAGAGGVFAATDRGVVRLSDGKRVIPAGDLDLRGITIAPNGDIFVSDGKGHRVHRFNGSGKPLGTIGEPGGPYTGVYTPGRMADPRGLAVGPKGKLWVTEDRWNPKRLLAWDLKAGRVVYEKFGMPHYGGDGSGFDPKNGRRWIGLGCFWDVDIDAGTARPTHIMGRQEAHFGKYAPQGYRFFRDAGRTFLATRGKIVVISEVLDNGTIRDIAAVAGTHHFAYGCGWDPPQGYIDAFYERFPGKRKGEKPGKKGEGKPWAGRVAGVLWVDRNADGVPQKEEFDFSDEGMQFAGGAWGHLQDSLTLRIPVVVDGRARIVSIVPRGFTPKGIPDYPTLNEAIRGGLPIGLTPGYKRTGVSTVRDRFGRFLFNSSPEMNAYGADGRHLWSYPNRWSDVHGSHDAPLPEPGVMQGAMAFLGMAPLDDSADVCFINGNHGRCYLMTSDGLYLDEMFTDVRVSYLKNEYRLGGEIFGGMFDRSERDGRYYVQIGHGPYRIYEVRGLDTVRRVSGRLDVTAAQVTAAERKTRRALSGKRVEKVFDVPGKIAWDQGGRFKTEVSAKVEGGMLLLDYRVQDPSPWVNTGRDWTMLFATGDTVDLQIGADPGSDPGRRSAVAGDARLMIAPFEGKQVAVLYRPVAPAGGNPIEFTSPWRGYTVADVRRVKEVGVTVKAGRAGYQVEARVPLSLLGLKPGGGPLRADFGVTFGDAEGTETQLRSYWSNKTTMLTDDIPGEIMFHPNQWGTIRFSGK